MRNLFTPSSRLCSLFSSAKRDGGGSIIQYVRMTPMDQVCQHAVTIESASVRIPNLPPADLASRYNHCGADAASLSRKIQGRVRRAEVNDSVRMTIVENCGSSQAVLHLPYPEQAKLDALKQSSPELARWWKFQEEIEQRAFGGSQVFYNLSEAQNEERQREGELIAPEILAGHFDTGLTPDCDPRTVCGARSFREELQDYTGPLGAHGYEPELVQAADYRFKRYVAPKYPLLALKARFSGKVKLDLSVDPGTRNMCRSIWSSNGIVQSRVSGKI